MPAASAKTRLAQARQMLPRSSAALVALTEDLEEIEAPAWFTEKLEKVLVTVAEEVNAIAREQACERMERVAKTIGDLLPTIEETRA